MPRTEDSVRQLGLLYEVVGVVVVVVEIRKASGRHSLDPLHVRFRRYMRALPLLAPVRSKARSSVTVDLHAAYAIAAGSAARLGDSSLEGRVASLEGRTAAVEAKQAELRQDIKQEAARAAEATMKEADLRQAADAALEARIKEAETGGLDLSFFGVLWLLIGMVLTTGTQEVCRWLLRCIG